MTRSTIRPVMLALLSLGLVACRQQGTAEPPPTQGELASADQLDRGELSDGVAVPHFDDNGYYEMVELVPIPSMGEGEPQDPQYAEVQISLDPELVEACGATRLDVTFGTDSTKVPKAKTGVLERLAACLNESPLDDDYLQIVGYTDPRGSKEDNRELGLDRADAVASVLIKNGVTKERIDTYSLGEAVASKDPDEWPRDRKVTVRLDR
jgi:outer membrane protein OmpA-like peptidoglycan-associated protein